MFDFDESVLNLFANGVSSNLNVSYAFCTHVVRPLDARSIVIMDDNWAASVVVVEASLVHFLFSLIVLFFLQAFVLLKKCRAVIGRSRKAGIRV